MSASPIWVALQLFAAAVVLLSGAAAIAAQPGNAERNLVVIFPPWTSGAEAARRAIQAGATLVTGDGYKLTVHADAPGYRARLAASGIVLVLSSRFSGCGA